MVKPKPLWFPSESIIQKSNIGQFMQEKQFKSYHEFHQWSYEHFPQFWEAMVQKLNIQFDKPYLGIVDLSLGVESPVWFKNAKLNIVKSCFTGNKNDIAIVSHDVAQKQTIFTYEALDRLSNQVANSLNNIITKGDKVAIIMPMTPLAIAIYLGIIKFGGVCVSIADSFSTEEIEKRLNITKTTIVFTVDEIHHNEKNIELYTRIQDIPSITRIVISHSNNVASLKTNDLQFNTFLNKNESFEPVSCNPEDPINILFSSGTTGDPKAIPWTQTTPIKCASDAYCHHDMKPQERFAWPTNLGWMMGPWLIFATLINHGTIALYEGAPQSKGFGEFIEKAKVNLLGVVPTLVKTWRESKCLEGLKLGSLKLFSSTGECSNPDDMRYLMSLTENRAPIIEYCGGTEIGGAYITGAMVQPQAPGFLTTPALGLNFVILETGEAALHSPSIGFSTYLLNKNHHQIYYANMPKTKEGTLLRRHGDQIQKYPNGFFRMLGRIDDTMNLGGIKVSSVEIEHVVHLLPDIKESAAVAITPIEGGPDQLMIYVVLRNKTNKKPTVKELKADIQDMIKKHLNPLFKVHDVVILDSLPRTASHKIIRRLLKK